MSIIKCKNGHFFDKRKYEECPFCKNRCTDISRMEETIWVNQIEQVDNDVTVGIYSDFKGNDFVTGWIVCVEGPDKGRDYRLHSGYNRIGRNMSLDINPVNDLKVSNACHCSIVYESRKNQFYFVPESGNISYLNNKLEETVQILKSGDCLQLGSSEFEFIAFCRGERKW